MIRFFYEELQWKVPKITPTKRWLKEVATRLDKQISNLNYIFSTDEYLLKINIDYLKHNTFTDIITFQYSENQFVIEGDVFISLDRIKENANQLKVSFDEELRRVMVHGLLHLCGYNDKSETEKKIMTQKEDESLLLFQL